MPSAPGQSSVNVSKYFTWHVTAKFGNSNPRQAACHWHTTTQKTITRTISTADVSDLHSLTLKSLVIPGCSLPWNPVQNSSLRDLVWWPSSSVTQRCRNSARFCLPKAAVTFESLRADSHISADAVIKQC